MLLISGPPGIGKTALLAEICQQGARMSLRVTRGGCDRSGPVSPGAPVIALLRAGPDPLLGAADYEQVVRLAGEPLVLADAIASRLAAAAPLLIAVDDLQWAGRITWLVLRMVVSRLADEPVTWLLASRDDHSAPDLAALDPVRVEHLRLGPLSPADLAAIARDRLGRRPTSGPGGTWTPRAGIRRSRRRSATASPARRPAASRTRRRPRPRTRRG